MRDVNIVMMKLIVFLLTRLSVSISTKPHGLIYPKIKEEWLSWRGCIDHHIATELCELRETVTSILEYKTTINLGLSTSTVLLTTEGLCMLGLDNPLLATWDELNVIAKRQGCYSLYDDGSKPWHISTLSPTTGIPASLCPPLESTGAPTMVLGGFTMHRISGEAMNPTVDTEAKLSCLTTFRGAKVLDTCCGLGYTATAVAKRVDNHITDTKKAFKTKSSIGNKKQSTEFGHVTTIEYDEASLEMCAHNPHSQGLFDGSLPITVIQGDSCEVVRCFPDRSFSLVIHDPPARALCRTDLYGVAFYQELRRVLTSSGTLYHYIGNPDSKESGRLYSGIINRLQEAGFAHIKKVPRAFGLIASAGVSTLHLHSDSSPLQQFPEMSIEWLS